MPGAVLLIPLLVACASGAGTQTASGGGDRSTTSATSRPTDGDPAFWSVKPDEQLSSASSSFTAIVSRLGCGGGLTGTVLPPTITNRAGEIVITFSVERPPSDVAYTCQGNRGVASRVDLGEPIGARQLIDGGCGVGQDAAATAACPDGGVRWRPPVG